MGLFLFSTAFGQEAISKSDHSKKCTCEKKCSKPVSQPSISEIQTFKVVHKKITPEAFNQRLQKMNFNKEVYRVAPQMHKARLEKQKE